MGEQLGQLGPAATAEDEARRESIAAIQARVSDLIANANLRASAEEGKSSSWGWQRLLLGFCSAVTGAGVASTVAVSNSPLRLVVGAVSLIFAGIAGALARRDPVTEERQSLLASAGFRALAFRADFFLRVDVPVLVAKTEGADPSANAAYKELRDQAFQLESELAGIEAQTGDNKRSKPSKRRAT